jgi:hypothetical protein
MIKQLMYTMRYLYGLLLIYPIMGEKINLEN